MDRNREQFKYVVQCRKVALRKESVDRNLVSGINRTIDIVSLSARRAWIEIGSLDDILAGVNESLSARRAWIEISLLCRILFRR